MWNFILNILKGFVGSVLPTKNSSKVGSEDSTGSGEKNDESGNKINWTYIIILLIVGGIGYCITPFWVNNNPSYPNQSSHTVVVKPALPDTTWTSSKPIQGTISSNIHVNTGIIDTLIETEVDSLTEDGTQVNIRATTWFKGKADTLEAQQILEWNIQPRPVEVITLQDSIFIYDSIAYKVELEPTIFQRPEVVIPSTSLATIILLFIFGAL